MIHATIDGAAVRDRRDLHERLARQLSLPAWYGKNLDALYDCLTEPGEDWLLRIEHPAALETVLGSYAHAFLRMLEDVQRENPRFRYELW